MKILDVIDFCSNNLELTRYVVKYKEKTYIKWPGYWTEIYNGENLGYGSVEVTFATHLNKVWGKNFGNKSIEKVVNIIVS